MTKFAPLEHDDYIQRIVVEPIDNGYLVKRYSSFSTSILHCEMVDLLTVFESAYREI